MAVPTTATAILRGVTRWLVLALVVVSCLALLWRCEDTAPSPLPASSGGATPRGAAPVEAMASIPATAARPDADATPERAPATASLELRGRVVDPRRRPLADVPVFLTPGGSLPPAALLLDHQRGVRVGPLAATRTDDRGHYALRPSAAVRGLPLQVHALAPGHGDAMLPNVRAHDAVTWLPDLVAQPAVPVRVLVVSTTDDAPIAGARVSVRPDGLSLLALRDREQRHTAVTAADGVATLHGLSTGSYTFRAEADGFATHELPQQAVQDAADTEVLLALGTGATLAGHVVDRAGRGIAGACVAATAVGGHPTARIATFTDANGRFALTGLATGPLRVEAGAVGFSTLGRQPVAAGDSPLVLTLAPTGRIRLTVVDQAGDLLSNWNVQPRPAGPAAGLRARPTCSVTANALRDGAFEIDDLEPGTWTLRVSHREFAPVTSAPIDVVGGAASEARVGLRPGATIGFFVRHADGTTPSVQPNLQPDGTPEGAAAEALLGLGDREEQPPGHTSAAGQYRLEHVAAGRWQLRLAVDGRAPHFVRGLLVGEADLDLGVLTLPSVTSLRGTALVDDAVDRSVVVQVLALPGGNLPAGYRLEATVAVDGTWRSPLLLPAGNYAVMAGRRRADDPFRENADTAASRLEITLDGSSSEQRLALRLPRGP